MCSSDLRWGRVGTLIALIYMVALPFVVLACLLYTSPAAGLFLLMNSGYTSGYRFGYTPVTAQKPHNCCNLTITADDGEVVTYALPYSAGIKVKDGDTVPKGLELTEGALSPHEVLRIRGLSDCHNYLIREVQKVYRQQGVDTNDKHIEVIVRQMMP